MRLISCGSKHSGFWQFFNFSKFYLFFALMGLSQLFLAHELFIVTSGRLGLIYFCADFKVTSEPSFTLHQSLNIYF
jgi:hypothetical protein